MRLVVLNASFAGSCCGWKVSVTVFGSGGGSISLAMPCVYKDVADPEV